MKLAFALGALMAATAVTAYTEDFSGDWESRWVQSKKKSDYGKWDVTAGKFYADEEASKGLHTSQDARFYAISSKMEKALDATQGKLVVQFEVKHEQNIDCGGGYIKVMPQDADLADFHGETPYYIMFGPDICGADKKIHLIFNYKGENLLWKKTPRAESDDLSHLYTLILDFPNQKYEVKVDGESKEKGNLEDDWAFLKPKEIDDPSDKKPSDWVDEPEMDDPTDKKPDGWDEIPETIADPDAKKPDDWDTEEDGEWEAPTIANPEYKGEWKAKRIPNPAYKGVWAPKKIANPDYVEDKELAKFEDIGAVGFDLWQVRSGTIFDNIQVTSSIEEADAAIAAFKTKKAEEKKAKDAQDEAARKKAEAEAAANAPAGGEEAAEAEEDDDEEL
eukprot:TRINITY_DN3587_c5_g1_i1.p1 TRINITY_DN3587_c5_g1~~TRINITY_DN3587_c5_g1_i1.p1  ORF type:complete len:402 (-),score=149.47 TRINITY_DN3587_c5_g1_i1:1510-2682(-)